MKKLFPNEEIIDTKFFNAHQDWETPISGFFIIASKRNIRSVCEFSEEELKEFIELVYRIRVGMKELLGIKRIFLFQNEDSKHYFHFWLFPQYSWMKKFGEGSRSIIPIKKYAEKHLATEKNMLKIKTLVQEMKKYLEENYAL
ncbi:MAG: diadenosine tetraphosphate hydrolase [Candidatus Pacearchaeota archaeon]